MVKDAILKVTGNKLHLDVLKETEKAILQDAAFQLLWETGVQVESEIAAERFQSAGALVAKENSGYLVKIPQWLLLDSIDSAPANQPWYGQSPEYDFHPEARELSLLMFGVHVKIIDPVSKELRNTTKADSDVLFRLLNQLPNIPVQLDALAATDYPSEAMSLAQMQAMLSASPKFAIGSAATPEERELVLKMGHLIAGGEKQFRSRPFLCITASPISPLLMKTECTDTLAFTAENGLYSHAVNMCLAGATGPVSLAGAVVLSVAELLAALVYIQIVKKGAPTILSTCSSIMDMRSGLAACGAPDTATICSISARMLAHYGIYGIFNSGVSDAKVPDAQSAYEFAANASFMAASRPSIVFGAGSLEGGLTFDYAKLLLDDECFSNIKKYLAGISWSKDDLALDLLKEVGPGGSYLQHRDTFKKFKTTLSQNNLFDRSSREAWENHGATNATERAYAKALTMINSPSADHLAPTVKEELESILAEHTKKYTA